MRPVVIISLIFISRVSGIEDCTYTKADALSGRVPYDASPVSVRCMLDCATVCSSNNDCRGFYYSENQRACHIDEIGFTNFQTDTSAVYQSKSGSGVRTVVSSNACPQTFKENILLLGSSGNYYTLTMVNDYVNKATAGTVCNQLGLQLIKVNDGTKILDVADFLDTCAVYNIGKYWTDAEKQIAEPGEPWRNSDGSEANVANIWCGTDDDVICLRFRPDCSYLLNDIPCNSNANFICE